MDNIEIYGSARTPNCPQNYIQNRKPQFGQNTGTLIGSNHKKEIDKMECCLEEVKRRKALERDAMMKLEKIKKNKGISFKTKKRIAEALVFPVVTYECENWIFRKLNKKNNWSI
ncbi:hypothetical protein LAZ67_2005936 [Cordylochernes scorpioides]|uniref:Uncharacterized protein n=1 Tax=Cordylochernes scorpioides TaxID=51811 RepID=A0ABY6K5S9_9ARAC|nr:hypothetical protein LAZ67_2005936 [Cordylochernes scorpioides]